MRTSAYESWLRRRGYDERTINAQLYRARRVEEHYGDLDGHFGADKLRALIAELTYSMEDARRGRPNPSTIPFSGNVRNNLAAYKVAVVWYGRFRDAPEGQLAAAADTPEAAAPAPSPGVVPAVSIRRRSVAVVDIGPGVGRRTLADFNLDGRAALQAVIAESRYRTIAQAIASLTLFSHPQTVRQTGGHALFPSIRDPRRVGQFDERDGRRVLLDDNKSPSDTFLWSNGLRRRGADTQFNHVWAASLDADAYTALPNLCMTPAFIAKLTDTNEAVRALLRYRSYQLYGWIPNGHAAPEKPEEYDLLEWAQPLPSVHDVRATIVGAMARRAKDRTVMAARELGWLFAPAGASSLEPNAGV